MPRRLRIGSMIGPRQIVKRAAARLGVTAPRRDGAHAERRSLWSATVRRPRMALEKGQGADFDALARPRVGWRRRVVEGGVGRPPGATIL